MRKPTTPAAVTLGSNVPPTCTLSARFPEIWRFLADDRWDDGTPRIPGTITLLVEAGRVKAALNDRDQHRSAFLSSDGLEPLLNAINQVLEQDKVEWRPWKENNHGKGR